MSVAWLGEGFEASRIAHAGRPAISVGAAELTYEALSGRVGELVYALDGAVGNLTAILCEGSVATYAGILAALYKGHGYVPLNPKFPVDRLAYMLEHSGCASVIVDASHEEMLAEVLAGITAPLHLVFADREDVAEWTKQLPIHNVVAGLGQGQAELTAQSPKATDPAYILYTSGSTGAPKGVAVSHANVRHFMEVMQTRYGFEAEDRFSHMFDLSFDLSVFDLFMAWKVGGCLCVPDAAAKKLPSEYILRENISVWFSVPSVLVLMERMRQLEPRRFDGIRIGLFCGEALPADATVAWAEATPNSTLHNIYGPTEVTLACTWYDIPRDDPGRDAVNGVIPIGVAYTGMTARVVDAAMNDVLPGEEGELVMNGPQVALGYWKDQAKTDAVFVEHAKLGGISYKTGDLVRQPESADAPIIYLGRIDHQIKLHGHRVELGEIEASLCEAAQAPRAVVLPWPIRNGVPAGLAAFVECENIDTPQIIARLKTSLPDYMIPKVVYAVEDFPQNANGKTDRRALGEMLK